MHIYLRLLPEKSTESAAEEIAQLQECLRQAPGIEDVKEISGHHKGGYQVMLEVSEGSIDTLLEHITSHGFLAGF